MAKTKRPSPPARPSSSRRPSPQQRSREAGLPVERGGKHADRQARSTRGATNAVAKAAAKVDVGIRSKVTSKSQTTLPSGVRRALHVGPGDEIEYVIEGDRAIIRRAAPVGVADEDPALLGFLDLLERDIAAHPERLGGIPQSLLDRMARVSKGVPLVDRDEPILGPVAI